MQVNELFEAAFPGKAVLTGWEDNDEDGADEDDDSDAADLLAASRAAVATLPAAVEVDLALDMGKMAV